MALGALPHGRGSVARALPHGRGSVAEGRFLTVAALLRRALPHGRGSVAEGASSRSRLCCGALPHGRGSVAEEALPHGRGSVGNPQNRAATVRERRARFGHMNCHSLARGKLCLESLPRTVDDICRFEGKSAVKSLHGRRREESRRVYSRPVASSGAGFNSSLKSLKRTSTDRRRAVERPPPPSEWPRPDLPDARTDAH